MEDPQVAQKQPYSWLAFSWFKAVISLTVDIWVLSIFQEKYLGESRQGFQVIGMGKEWAAGATKHKGKVVSPASTQLCALTW